MPRISVRNYGVFKVGDRVRIKSGVPNFYFLEGETGVVTRLYTEDVTIRLDNPGDFVSRNINALGVSLEQYINDLRRLFGGLNDDNYPPDDELQYVRVVRPLNDEYAHRINSLSLDASELELVDKPEPNHWPPKTSEVYQNIKKDLV